MTEPHSSRMVNPRFKLPTQCGCICLVPCQDIALPRTLAVAQMVGRGIVAYSSCPTQLWICADCEPQCGEEGLCPVRGGNFF